VTFAAAPYMEWAKTRPRPRIDLAGSNLLACRLEDLPGAREAVELAGESPEGYPPLREAIARRYGVAPAQVATAVGCSGANFLALSALLEPGDEVVAETPHYDPILAAARMAGATVRSFERRLADNFDVDPDAVEAAMTPKTRVVAITNPHNPSGVIASPARLAALARLMERRGVRVLVDEVYLDAANEPGARSAVHLSPLFVTTNSLTKSYGLASLRCGWILASGETAARVRRVRDAVDVWSPMPADRLSVLAFRHLPVLAERARRIVEANRAAVVRFLAGRSDLASVAPKATIAFPRLEGASSADSFAERLFETTGTAVAPGRFFGAPRHFRIAFGGDPAAVAEGLAAVARTLDAFDGAS
jgi:aspartate/methionine/tyrosine aminotransferase